MDKTPPYNDNIPEGQGAGEGNSRNGDREGQEVLGSGQSNDSGGSGKSKDSGGSGKSNDSRASGKSNDSRASGEGNRSYPGKENRENPKRRGYYKLQVPAPAVHIAIWLLTMIIPAIIFRGVKSDTGLPRAFFPLSTLLHIGLFYLNTNLLYPKLLTRKLWPIYVVLIAAIIPAINQGKLLMLKLADPAFVITRSNKAIVFFPPVAFLLASFIFIFIRRQLLIEKHQKEKQAEAVASELRFLRSQVNPHFLFNVMTSLVSMARSKSDQLEPTLIRFAEMLRYSLYETNQERFPIAKEIEYLKNYIELQKLRFGEDVDIKTNVQESDRVSFIEPMLLIPFVENAFKHGIGLVPDPFIHINLTVDEILLTFTVTNNYISQVSSKDHSSGIGLANVKNRLELLYGKRYQLIEKGADGIYHVELKIILS